ncbi:methyl-accepting chemotaxis protein [Oceanisphaera avium]|uniref:Chemotaxis protein n=1 Tax=Oceanisphaera avium TaxID=1903694 RepID=A0A1Y0CWL8_9GAMM|nr:methyl-accepting chemotaxis protein [Oceanisphaera avium]ART79404.1 chemotaxis protein [Oceanisphaera avium]
MQKFKLRTVLIAFVTLTLMLLTLVSTLININQFSNLYYKQTEQEFLPTSVGQVAEKVRAELMPAVILSKDMAHNPLLLDWMRDGEDASEQDAQVRRYFKQQQVNANASTLFWVSGQTNTNYRNGEVFKRISPNDPLDGWFYSFLESGVDQVLQIDPDEQSGKLMLFVNTLVTLDGKPMGVAGLGYDVSSVVEIVSNYKLGKNGYLYLVDQDGQVIVHPDINVTRKKVSELDTLAPANRLLKQHQGGFSFDRDTVDDKSVYIAAQDIRDTGLTLIAVLPTAETSSAINKVISSSVWVSVLLTLLFIGLTVLFANSLSKSIRRVGDDLLSMSGQGGDLTTRLDERHDNELGHLAKGFNAIIGKIRELVAEIQQTETAMKTSIEQLAQLANDTFASTDLQRGQTDQVATAITEMGQTITEVSGIAHRNANDTESAVADTNNTNDNMALTSRTMQELNGVMADIEHTITDFAHQAAAINSVVEVINDISEQTNLLALNAAIEAARAGEQGRGFAVVADEVRSLAQRTQASTLEIREQINQLQHTAQQSTKAIQQGTISSQQVADNTEQSAAALLSIQQKFEAISSGNHQVAAATEEQGAVAEHINESAYLISDSAASIYQNAEQQLLAIQELQQRAQHLRGLVAQFKV